MYQWFASYLADRTHFVQIHNYWSESSIVHHGVSQGSVLGPLMFIIDLPLGNIFRHCGIHFNCYADDTQLYVSTKSTSTFPSSTLIACFHDLQIWMKNNYLKLNSELLFIGSKSTQSKTNICSLPISESTQVKSLCTHSFSSHINKIFQIFFFHLRNISRLRPALTQH